MPKKALLMPSYWAGLSGFWADVLRLVNLFPHRLNGRYCRPCPECPKKRSDVENENVHVDNFAFKAENLLTAENRGVQKRAALTNLPHALLRASSYGRMKEKLGEGNKWFKRHNEASACKFSVTPPNASGSCATKTLPCNTRRAGSWSSCPDDTVVAPDHPLHTRTRIAERFNCSITSDTK